MIRDNIITASFVKNDVVHMAYAYVMQYDKTNVW